MFNARLAFALLILIGFAGAARAAVVIEPPANASPVEALAAMEIQRYIYLRTGELPVIGSDPKAATRIVVAGKDRSPAGPVEGTAMTLAPGNYVLKTTTADGRRTLWVIGGDDIGTLYGAYRFAEKLGVRFYLHGDVIPDERLKGIPDVNDAGKPLFSVRGIQPFHDFPDGPDWWNTDDYLSYITQLPKLRMNFLGLHCYPEGGAGPEPLVWIGQPSDVDEQGRVSFSSPSHWANTRRDGAWGYSAMPTSDFTCGADLLFAGEQYGPDVMEGMLPKPGTPEQCNTVFERAGRMFRTAFTWARALGVKTCVGTETPLTIPASVKERLKASGKDPADPAVVREVYRGMFQRIARLYPVDYYWLWTPEGWTWGGNSEEQLNATISDIRAALGALDDLGKPFTLATCGWVLGPAQDRAALDKVLPKDSPMSCINRSVGHAPVEPSFASVAGRPKWAIPWVENDPAMTAPQPWVGRMRYDAADAKRYGCTGLLGIHWRTKILSQNMAALADAAWDQSWAPADYHLAEEESRQEVDGPLGGRVVTYPAPVDKTDEDTVYQSVRYNVDGYRLKIPNGTYTVGLKFNDPAYGEAGKRVFGVSIQGERVIDSLDMAAHSGKNVAIDYEFADIPVTAGVLKIDFTRIVEFPCVAGIVVQGKSTDGKGSVRKINCGGEAYRDYEADKKQIDDKMDQRTMPVGEFYTDFARANFGANVAESIGGILAGIDGRNLHEPAHWIKGPGGIAPNKEPWAQVKERYVFVDKLAAVAPQVRGAGNRERFDYWLNTFRFMSAMAELGCLRGELDLAMESVKAAQEVADKSSLAEKAVGIRVKMARVWERMMTAQLAAVDTPAEMGTVANLEQHSRATLKLLSEHDGILVDARGAALPAEAELSKAYAGPSRIIVPTVRTQVQKGESLRVKAIVLDKALPKSVDLHWRTMGKGTYNVTGMRNIGRATYGAELPSAETALEYYITARTSDGKSLVWPATAPGISQTVVVWDVLNR